MNLPAQAIQQALKQQWPEAIKINLDILKENPNDVDTLNRLALAYIQTDKIQKAKEIYQQILTLDSLNPIAKRNLQKLENHKGKTNCKKITSQMNSNNFIEEPGRTKIVSLVRLGERDFIALLQPCQELEFSIRQKTVIFSFDKKYIGRLPDDISRRLIWLYKRNNRYTAFVKTVTKSKVVVFIKEIKRSYQNKNYSSFLPTERT